MIEGQGSLLHPAYAAVTLGLLHGSQPDAIVLCHAPERVTIEEYPDYPIPPLPQVIDEYLRAGRLTNRNVRCVGISINSSTLDDDGWRGYRAQLDLRSDAWRRRRHREGIAGRMIQHATDIERGVMHVPGSAL